MVRVLVTAILIMISFLLQTTAFKMLALADVVPNLLLIVTAAAGYMRGRVEALLVGFTCGLLVDCMYGDVIGLYALLFLTVGYLSGYAHMIYFKDDYTLPIFLIGASDLLYNIFYYIISFLLRNRLNFLFYLRRIILPELVYTLLVALVFYKLLHSINGLLERFEQREG
ncbi:rod shape-determining protein MreD [Anaeromicropila populeti]|uniref:Rod shape-determining protein MreD n=1 Tax=Anaeromicropila populeti TaxID=37658 RepID=A0A1I6L7V6_9FIRM|nr:rod shape-determining protein MreD [Anaeromicropila populeti]SFR99556.1 rod shape-determining protein MreD [Anaeromicropila populeti]